MKERLMLHIESLLHSPFDCLILVSPQIHVLDKFRERIHSLGIPMINVNEKLSSQLITIPSEARGKAAQDWLMGVSLEDPSKPLLLASIDLLFHPSLRIDPFKLICGLSRSQKLILLWPGNFQDDLLSYAIPEHCHYRVWKTPASSLIYPIVLIHQVDSEEGV